MKIKQVFILRGYYESSVEFFSSLKDIEQLHTPDKADKTIYELAPKIHNFGCGNTKKNGLCFSLDRAKLL